ncbi:stage III sporulation protein AF [Moorellaceae bacterium AZ2]
MLQIIGEIVRQVALIAILAGLLEMMLPQQTMNRYVRLVLGLFVLVAILSPLAERFSRGQALEVMAWDFRPRSMEEKLETLVPPSNWQTATGDAAMEIFRERLGSQMRTLIALIPGVRNAEVQVEVQGAPDNLQRARISSVAVTVEWAGAAQPEGGKLGTGAGEEEFKVPGLPGAPATEEELAARIKQTLAFFYGLDAGVITVRGR